VANIACWRKRRLRDPLLRRLWLVSKRLLAGTDSVKACARALARDIKINVPSGAEGDAVLMPPGTFPKMQH